jgi:hypothetical protein
MAIGVVDLMEVVHRRISTGEAPSRRMDGAAQVAGRVTRHGCAHNPGDHRAHEDLRQKPHPTPTTIGVLSDPTSWPVAAAVRVK